jgi:hypothetical protein
MATGIRNKREGGNQSRVLDFLEYTGILRYTHAEQLFRSPVFIKDVIGILPELLHVRSYKHLAELDKVAVLFVVNFDDTPRVGPTADFSAVWSQDDCIRTDHRERNFARDFLRFCYGLLILVLVGRGLENVDIVISNVC